MEERPKGTRDARSAVVVGGGVVGLCVARELSAAGLEVTVVEAGAWGAGASQGNGGWVTPSLSTPLAAPGAMRSALAWMLRPASPFAIRPRLDRAALEWYWRFWRSCAPAPFRAGLDALLALNGATFALYDRLRDAGVAFEMHERGLVFAARTEHGLHHAEELRALLAAAGCAGIGDLLDPAALRTLEPALGDRVRGGFLAARERHVRPESLVAGLVAALRQAGAQLLEHTTATRLEPVARSGWRVHTSAGRAVEAERAVVAAGPATLRLVAGFAPGAPLLQPAKGYSITSRGAGRAPRHAVYLVEARVGCSPFDGAMRLAGTLELGVAHTRLNRRRIAAVAAAADDYFASWRPTADGVEWAGLRTLAPDALPLIGAVPGHRGLHVATGHGMLGVTLAPATAASLAPLVVEDRLVSQLRPFAPGRFARRR